MLITLNEVEIYTVSGGFHGALYAACLTACLAGGFVWNYVLNLPPLPIDQCHNYCELAH